MGGGWNLLPVFCFILSKKCGKLSPGKVLERTTSNMANTNKNIKKSKCSNRNTEKEANIIPRFLNIHSSKLGTGGGEEQWVKPKGERRENTMAVERMVFFIFIFSLLVIMITVTAFRKFSLGNTFLKNDTWYS